MRKGNTIAIVLIGIGLLGLLRYLDLNIPWKEIRWVWPVLTVVVGAIGVAMPRYRISWVVAVLFLIAMGAAYHAEDHGNEFFHIDETSAAG